MKILLINGSPNEKGNTYVALRHAADAAEKAGVETEIVTIGKMPIVGCNCCGGCAKTGRCVIKDGSNEIYEKMCAADGIIIGSPVYFSGINGTLKSFLDRMFRHSEAMRFKPVAGIVALRRTGASLALQSLHQYFAIAEMLEIPSNYWAAAHGGAAGEAEQDREGIQICEIIGENMAYFIKVLKESKVQQPDAPAKIRYNFIR